MTRRARGLAIVAAFCLIAAGCGDDDTASPTTTGSPSPTATSTAPPAPTTTMTAAPTTPPAATPTTARLDCALGAAGTRELLVGDVARSYDLYLPPDLEPAGPPAPAMVLFHGFTSNAAEIAASTGLGALAPELGVVLVVPQGAGEPSDWHITDPSFGDTEFSDAVLDVLVGSPCVDPDNVWLAGFSAGSAWSAVYGCGHADRLAGLVLVSGLAPPICPDNHSPDVQITHGTADPVVPFEGGDQPVGGSSMHLDSVPDSAAGWAERAGCGESPATTTVGDLTEVTTWSDCGGDATVTLHASAGLGHVWPIGVFNPGCVALRTMLGADDPYEPCA